MPRAMEPPAQFNAAEVRDELVAGWPGRELDIGAADNEGAAACDVVVVATPWDGVTATDVASAAVQGP